MSKVYTIAGRFRKTIKKGVAGKTATPLVILGMITPRKTLKNVRFSRSSFSFPYIELPKVPGKSKELKPDNAFGQSGNHTLKRPFFEVEFPICLYRVLKGAWKIREAMPESEATETCPEIGQSNIYPGS